MKKKRKKELTAALVVRLAVAACAGVGLTLNSGLAKGALSLQTLAYYTNLSNLAVFLIYLADIPMTACALVGKRRPAGITRVKAAGAIAITITFLIYHFLLAPSSFSMAASPGFWQPGNLLAHYVVPLFTLADWMFLERRGCVKGSDPLLWLFVPAAYLVYTLIRAQLGVPFEQGGSRYPYFFLDTDLLGWGGMLAWAGGIGGAFLLLGYLFYGFDRLLAPRQKRWR